jgi:hypothetical protein
MKTPPTRRLSDSEKALQKALQMSQSNIEKLEAALQKALQTSIGKTYPAAWLFDIDNRLAAMRKAWSKSRGSERDRHLLGALNLCGPFRPLPDWLCTALQALLTERLSQPPPINWTRWNLVLALRDVSDLTWDETLERASEILADTPARGGPEAIRKSYQAIEHSLPPQQRRPRTYRRKPPLG